MRESASAEKKLEIDALYDLTQFSDISAEYERNKKGRSNERWFDWTKQIEEENSKPDELDKLIDSPFAVAKRAFTPWNKKREMAKDNNAVAESYNISKAQAERVKREIAYRPTSIFGGAGLKQLQGGGGAGWKQFYAEPPIHAGQKRDNRFQKKFDSSNFPRRYDEFCNREFRRMNKKALLLGK